MMEDAKDNPVYIRTVSNLGYIFAVNSISSKKYASKRLGIMSERLFIAKTNFAVLSDLLFLGKYGEEKT